MRTVDFNGCEETSPAIFHSAKVDCCVSQLNLQSKALFLRHNDAHSSTLMSVLDCCLCIVENRPYSLYKIEMQTVKDKPSPKTKCKKDSQRIVNLAY